MLIVDYSWSHPKPEAIKAAGYVGAMRYLTSKVDAKLLQAGERDALHAAGLAIGLIWQTTADEARTGALGGVQRALRAEEMATALGYPLEAPLFFAVDFDATPDLVAPYFEGILDTLTRPAGVYGSHRVVEGLPEVPYVWQCAAWSRGRISEKAHLYQRVGHTSQVRADLGTTDENRLYQSMPLWLPGGAVMLMNPMKGKITSPFGPRKPPLPSPHLGIDIAGGGAPVRAVADGKVKAARSNSYDGDKTAGVILPGRTGNGVLIGHTGFSTYSGHLSKVYVKSGDAVKAGQIIGVEGATGNVYGRHLHFEVHPGTGSTAADPWPWMKAKGVTLGADPYTVAYVREVQSLLNVVAKAGLVEDGDLGPRTIAAVEAYQRAAGLRVDGDPGPITLAALRDAAIPPAPTPEPPAPPAPEEDAMPTPQDLWLHPLELPAERRRDGDPTHMPAEAMVGHAVLNARDAYESALRAEAKADAALAAVQALTLDPAATAAAIGGAVDQALSGLRITRQA